MKRLNPYKIRAYGNNTVCGVLNYVSKGCDNDHTNHISGLPINLIIELLIKGII